jgi:hypothetical protein
MLGNLLSSRRHLADRVALDSYDPPPLSGLQFMITPQECAALSCFAERAWSNGAARDGLIIDAGCFVGASTVAFAQGIERSRLSENARAKRIISYDLFYASQNIIDQALPDSGLSEGDSFEPIFRNNIRPYAHYIDVRSGDIINATAPSRPITVLFVDVLWSAEATVHFGRTFYPMLERRRSALVHQDFVYPYLPWLILSMGMLMNKFSISRNIPYSSLVFNVERSVRPEDIDDPRDLSLSSGEAIFDDFIKRLEGWGKGALAISKSLFFGSRGELGRARKIVEDVWMKCSDQPLVMQYRPTIERVLSRAEKEGTRYDAEQIAGKTGR